MVSALTAAPGTVLGMCRAFWACFVQRHSFRAKPTLDIAGSGSGPSFGAAGPSIFGPGAVAAESVDDEHSLTWTSGAARNRQGSNTCDSLSLLHAIM
jgi:hypothetical protein